MDVHVEKEPMGSRRSRVAAKRKPASHESYFPCRAENDHELLETLKGIQRGLDQAKKGLLGVRCA
jgi:hypothetical protein